MRRRLTAMPKPTPHRVLAVAVLMIGTAALDYLVGRASAPSRVEAHAARLEAFSRAAQSTRAIAYRVAFNRAAKSGRHDAGVKGRRRGATAGKRRARKVLARRASPTPAPAANGTAASANEPPYEHLG